MSQTIPGIHHVTAIAGDPQRNLDFYTGFLGLRFVKKTVNFDDPATYHFYYGDEIGRPGSVLTFFPWTYAARGRPGPGMASVTSFTVPEGSIDYWMGRFAERAYDFESPRERFGEQVLAFQDPDGLRLELVARERAGERAGWAEGPVPAEHAVRSFHNIALLVADFDGTADLLTEVFGYEAVGEEGDRARFRAPESKRASCIDLIRAEGRGRMGAGTVHHVAFRCRDEEEQLQWKEVISRRGLSVTEVKDRQYFKSIYFREPSGVLFEIATDGPGFTADEPVEGLGSELKLPPWLEPRREKIAKRLPEVRVAALFEEGGRSEQETEN